MERRCKISNFFDICKKKPFQIVRNCHFLDSKDTIKPCCFALRDLSNNYSEMKHQRKRVIVSVTNDLVTDQRVHRSCMAMHQAGYEVLLVGRRLPTSAPVKRPYATARMRLLFRRKAFFYADYNFRLFWRLLFTRADLFYANDTDALPANYLAAWLRRKPLFFDAHEMFPEVPELVGRPRVKAVWQRIEDCLFPRMARRPHTAAVTVCRSIADRYAERYGLTMGVVRNVPMRQPSEPAADARRRADALLASLPADRQLLLYQGAVNVGRGVDWVMAAMPHLDGCHLVVAGVGDEYERLHQQALQEPYCHCVTFLGRVEPAVLRLITPHAALGLSLLENRGLNYYYSLPNRLADFVQASVPVLATDFPEIHRLVATYEIGTLVPPEPFDPVSRRTPPPDARKLADTIRQSLHFWQSLPADERRRRFDRAAADLSWENDKNILLQQLQTII